MIRTCGICGKNWGGLVRNRAEPTPKDCQWCGATADQQMEAVLKKAQQDVAAIIRRERAGEYATAEITEMGLR